jgi:signal peptidase I
MHNRFVRVAFGILTVLGTLMLVAVAALGVATPPGPDGVGRLAGHPVLTILSGSMSPAFGTGDVVVDRVVPASGTTTLRSGDVITFRAPDGWSDIVSADHPPHHRRDPQRRRRHPVRDAR